MQCLDHEKPRKREVHSKDEPEKDCLGQIVGWSIGLAFLSGWFFLFWSDGVVWKYFLRILGAR